jgi:homocysteine S-methyltransferase
LSNFLRIIKEKPLIITDAGIETRIIYEMGLQLPKEVEVAGMIYQQKGREALAQLYNSYLDIGQSSKLPIIIGTPTFRANPHRVLKAGLNLEDIILRCTNLLVDLRQKRGMYKKNIFIAGVIGPKNDAFNPNEALSTKEAFNYHTLQINAFKKTKIDFLFAVTFPALSEALGISQAMALSGYDYVISFVLNKSGLILDGHTITEAIKRIDSQVKPPPSYYSLNCIHPSVAIRVLDKLLIKDRVLEIKANSSHKSPQELQALSKIDRGNIKEFAKEMQEIHRRFGVKILGGCCGTDESHLSSLVKKSKIKPKMHATN